MSVQVTLPPGGIGSQNLKVAGITVICCPATNTVFPVLVITVASAIVISWPVISNTCEELIIIEPKLELACCPTTEIKLVVLGIKEFNDTVVPWPVIPIKSFVERTVFPKVVFKVNSGTTTVIAPPADIV